MTGEAADQRNRDGDAGGRRHEVLDGERGHLHEIAHRRLAAVPLPVRVRHEAHGGVERLVGAHLGGAKSLRIERQQTLEPHERVRDQKGKQAERQKRCGVLRPPLFLILADAAQLVDEHFDRPEHRMQERPLALEQPRHEQPDWFGDGQNQAEEHDNLQNANASHRSASKLLGLEHRPPEVHEQKHRNDAGHDVIEHVRSPTPGHKPS